MSRIASLFTAALPWHRYRLPRWPVYGQLLQNCRRTEIFSITRREKQRLQYALSFIHTATIVTAASATLVAEQPA
jgi:hypothetical protein